MGLIFFPYTDKTINNTTLVVFIFELGLDYFEKNTIISLSIAGIAQLVEHHVANVNVASSNLVSRSRFLKRPVYQVFFIEPFCTPPWPDSKSALQWIANPSRPVRFWFRPPYTKKPDFLSGFFIHLFRSNYQFSPSNSK